MLKTGIALPLLALLAACGSKDDGTSISIRSDNETARENLPATANGTDDGTLTLKTPGFEGSIKLPKFNIGADNFEFDGVKLYPGTRITQLNIADTNSAADVGGVNVTFESPAKAGQVRSWFRGQMEAAGFNVNGNHEALTGRTASGSIFTLRIDPADGDKSAGRLTVRGA